MHRNIIIFDLDGTLYDLNDVVQSNYDMQLNFLCEKKDMSRQEAVHFLANHHIYPIMKKDSLSATELFLQIGLSKEEWSAYRDIHFKVENIDIQKAVNESTLKEFSKIGILVLLSSNAYSVIDKILNHLSISPCIFDEIICSDRFPYNTSFKKKLAMVFLSSKYNVEYVDMYSMGDRYSTDILPMLELGGIGFLIKNNQSLSAVFNAIKEKSFCSTEDYICYHSNQT